VRIGRGIKTMVLCFRCFEVEGLEEGQMGWETMRYLSCGRAWHSEGRLIPESWDAIISNVLQDHFQGPSP
jgi:hypothetical protein